MIRLSQYLWLTAASASFLVAFLTIELNAPFEPSFYVFAHTMLGALATVLLLGVLRRRQISLLGSPVVSFVLVMLLYFTVNSVKYYVPNRVYEHVFTLTPFERFAGSLGAWAVIVAGVGLLAVLPPITATRVRQWWEREPTLGAVLWFCVLISGVSKVVLIQLGYGGPYAESAYNATRVRTYSDLVTISAGSFFEVIAFVLGMCVLVDAAGKRFRWSWTLPAAAAAVAISAAWAIYVQARMPFLFLILLGVFAVQIRSHRRALLSLQIFLLVLPLAAVSGANVLTVVLGRSNVTGVTFRDTVGELGYRADLTDLAIAVMLRAGSDSAGMPVVVDALTNAVPRILWPTKDQAYTAAYYGFLERHGFPRMDYLETPFSNGVVAFGPPGFVLWPILYLLLLTVMGVVTQLVCRRRGSRHYALLALGLLAMRVENEWEGVMLLLRDYLLFAPVLVGITLGVRVWRGSGLTMARGVAGPAGPGPVLRG